MVVVSGSELHRHHHQSADSAVAPTNLSELPGTGWVGTAVSDWLSQQSGTGPGGAVVRTVLTTQLQPDLNRKVDLISHFTPQLDSIITTPARSEWTLDVI